MSPDLWQRGCEQLATELSEQQFNTWIKPLSAQVQEDFSKVTIFVANRFKLDWVRAQYSARIAALIARFTRAHDGEQNEKAAELGIAPGNVYALDFFFAERHTSESNLRIETSLTLLPPSQVPEPASFALVLAGLAGMGWVGRRRRS